jgi:aryl carrier-like protein
MGSSPLYEHLVAEERHHSQDLSSVDRSKSIEDTICELLDLSLDDLSPDVPLTNYGLDSLSAATLSFALRPYVTITQTQLLADVTLKNLKSRMSETLSSLEGESESVETKITEMEHLVSRYSSNFSTHVVTPSLNHTPEKVILITGSSGMLGIAILNQLLQQEAFTHVYVFNRPPKLAQTSLEKHIAAFKSRHFDISLLSMEKLVFLEGALDQPHFGLPSGVYHKVNSTHLYLSISGLTIISAR